MFLTPIEIMKKISTGLTKDIIFPETLTFVSNIRLKFLSQASIAKSHGVCIAAKQMY